MTAITMQDADKMIRACYRKNQPLLLAGPPGCGKTSMYERICREDKLGFIDFRMTLKDQVEIGGMRVPDFKTNLLKHFPPDDLPNVKVHGPKGIILFDEINVVPQMMQATAYGLIQERRNGSYRMPEGWVPMASINLVKHRAAAQRMSSALANRFNCQEVAPDVPSWVKQYGEDHVDSRGVAYMLFRPANACVLPGDRIRMTDSDQEVILDPDQIAFPTFRSWTNAFKFIDESPTFRRKIYAGHVGDIFADDFEAYWRLSENAASIHEIIADPKTARVPQEGDAGTNYAVAGMISRLMDRKNINPIMVYVNRLQKDYQVFIMQTATKREAGLKNTQAYGQWQIKNQDVTL